MSVLNFFFLLFFLLSLHFNLFSSFHRSCCLFRCSSRINISILSSLSSFLSNHFSKSILGIFWRLLIHETSWAWVSFLFVKFEWIWLCGSFLRLLLFKIIVKVLLQFIKIWNISCLYWLIFINSFWCLRLQLRFLLLNLFVHFHSWRKFCFLVTQLSISSYSFLSFHFVCCHHLFEHFNCHTRWRLFSFESWL